jgi:hypothetical protein
MLFILASLALSQAAATPTGAVPTTVTPQGQVEVVAPQQPRRICRIERDTTSRISSRRICQTVQERSQERDENQREAGQSVNRQWDRTMGDQPFSPFAQAGGGVARSTGSPQ